jgi:hypothetical protein
MGAFSFLAERVGFEPTLRHNRKPDFESGAFDHSATSPGVRIEGRESYGQGAEETTTSVALSESTRVSTNRQDSRFAQRSSDNGPAVSQKKTRAKARV